MKYKKFAIYVYVVDVEIQEYTPCVLATSSLNID